MGTDIIADSRRLTRNPEVESRQPGGPEVRFEEVRRSMAKHSLDWPRVTARVTTNQLAAVSKRLATRVDHFPEARFGLRAKQ